MDAKEEQILQEDIKEISSIISFQKRLFYPITIPSDSEENQIRNNILYSLHELNLKSFETIQYLISTYKVSDIFALSRQIFETTINMGLLAKPIIPDDLEKFCEYDFFQINKGNTHIKEMKLDKYIKIEESRVSEISEKVKQIKQKRNYKNNPQSWTNTDLLSRTKLIDENYLNYIPEQNKHFYELLYCQLYRASSQVLHATPAGFLKMYEFNPELKKNSVTHYKLKLVDGIMMKAAEYTIISFLSSIRFFGIYLNKTEAEEYFKEKILEHYNL
ncbi:MAG: hypothetical protein CVV21_08625 [Candidatus Goldiibacteriota bacterium HGW-Goldbacteria-1]|jgi:hypothetical protein|nr:MAG: hypothetical protein CVV21_08625 [Candidatus Goldiibacteriota bacterium HGW-Goldbacteria-1]